MTGQWKDRIIRGGAIAVMTVAALGGMVGLTGVMAGYPGALRAGGILPRATGARPRNRDPCAHTRTAPCRRQGRHPVSHGTMSPDTKGPAFGAVTGSSRESENAVPGYPRPTAPRRRASNSHATGFHQGSDLGADSIDAPAPLGCRAKAAAACQPPGSAHRGHRRPAPLLLGRFHRVTQAEDGQQRTTPTVRLNRT